MSRVDRTRTAAKWPGAPRHRCSVKCAPATVGDCCGTVVTSECAPSDCFRSPRQSVGEMRASECAVAPRRVSGGDDFGGDVVAVAPWRRRTRMTIGKCRVSTTIRDGALEEWGDSRSSATRRDGALDFDQCRGGNYSRTARCFGYDGVVKAGLAGLEIKDGPGRTMRWTRARRDG